ncbi:MAG TPA: M20/M25/M40 family metallo-hydrolase [Candidatus Hydrogenedentes bacterium]|nr:M20/M25/M40 family metallo-hydrolase [Candidatus Hydrogenedentota bacterium]HPG65405.1 M20/M25/M40 family metallo-hydrolase [Candidatus Hydrogenedentota bacterium]
MSRQIIRDLMPEAEQFLAEFLRFPSVSGKEHEAMLFLDKAFAELDVEVERVPMTNALRADPDYSDPIPDLAYDGRFNLRIRRRGTGGGKTLLFNAHTDVVPPSEGQESPWSGRIADGVAYGRGACDDKGPLTSIYLTLKALDALGVRLKGDVVAHLVVEEENGGNGSLAMARAGERADGCIVLEPTDHKVFTSIRGAVWFRIVFKGKAGHSGQAGQTRSALLLARDAMAILERYHDDLLAASRGLPLFDPYPNPMPITFGRLEAGNWPSAAPNRAVLEGVLGLLPNKTKEEVCAEMRQALLDGGLTADDFDLGFTYRHDSSVVEVDHELPQTLLGAAEAAGSPAATAAMTASCDAWFYNNQLGIPTVVYGPGSLKVAHSKDEVIELADIERAAGVFVRFLMDYCGAEQS